MNKISFCTVCMNRIHHLQQTLPQNIADNLNYTNVEFVVLDYNSSDGLEEWIKEEMSEHINSGILKYYKTTEPEYFDRSHSRNVLFKLATGDVICNLDADNYTGNGFASYINDIFSTQENIYLVADTKKRFYFLRNAFGRFCVKKSDVMSLRGLDEKMKSYGSETVDFYERLEMAGKKEVIIENTHYLKTISHGDEERISNEFFLKSLKYFYIRYISTEESEILFFYKDNTFENAVIIPDNINAHLPASLKKDTLKKGTYHEVDNAIVLKYVEGTQKSLLHKERTLVSNGTVFHLLDEPKFLLHVAKNYAFITNVETLSSNKAENKIVVNDESFGVSKVTMNFTELVEV